MKNKVVAISVTHTGHRFVVFFHRRNGDCALYNKLSAASVKRVLKAMLKLTGE